MSGKYKIRRFNNRYRVVYKKDHRFLRAAAIISALFIISVIGHMRYKEFYRKEAAEIIKHGAEEEMKEGGKDRMISLLCDVLTEQLGKPYTYSKEGPDSFDCSGLVRYAYGRIGIELPRVAADQAEAGKTVEKGSLRFGDLLFFSEDTEDITHAGIYAGSGYMIHAPKPGDVVKLERIDTEYFNKTFVKAVRIIDIDSEF